MKLKKIRNVEENKKAKDKILLSGIMLAFVIPSLFMLAAFILAYETMLDSKPGIVIFANFVDTMLKAFTWSVIIHLVGVRKLYLLFARTNGNVRDLEKGSKRDFEEENERIIFGL